VGWQFKEGRDFSREYKTDSSAVIINEAAAKFMAVKNPVGKYVRWTGNNQTFTYTVIGVAKDMIMESPYDPVRPTIYFMDYDNVNWIDLKLNPNKSATESISKIETIFKKIIPASPFDYKFADTEFAEKFASETRVGKLSAFFAVLAIFISCLGLFGLASFVAEQRTKEIGSAQSIGSFCLFTLENAVEGLCGAGHYFDGDRNARLLLFHASLVAELSIPDRNILVGICFCGNLCHIHYARNSQLSKY
jgi:putative ABC transport system permease protein